MAGDVVAMRVMCVRMGFAAAAAAALTDEQGLDELDAVRDFDHDGVAALAKAV